MPKRQSKRSYDKPTRVALKKLFVWSWEDATSSPGLDSAEQLYQEGPYGELEPGCILTNPDLERRRSTEYRKRLSLRQRFQLFLRSSSSPFDAKYEVDPAIQGEKVLVTHKFVPLIAPPKHNCPPSTLTSQAPDPMGIDVATRFSLGTLCLQQQLHRRHQSYQSHRK